MTDELDRSTAAQTWASALAALSNVPGHEAGVQVIERAPGVAASPHYHPDGHEWVFVAAGSLALTNGERPETTLHAGEVAYIAPNVVHHARNPSDTEPVRIVLFRVKPADKPLLVRV